jgi:hypothetical protein
MRELVEAEGGSLDGLRVVGTLVPVKGDDGTVDVAATMDQAPALVAAGVSDFQVYLNVPSDASAAFDLFAANVEAFRAAVGTG